MTAPARLLSLRLHGFKSFAEKTVVEFGSGISAIVGPNGSGKSNLADGLRWALGEQGRSLRIRKSEDVVWAGSDRRAAVGMADVTLVLDNADALLPVEYAVVELGRRLYRSGENDYLLNRQRVRLRDLVDLLDTANLADNAFLFIGQGMVDQALALRPEERRPLFEEVAGVRRHERRRRKAQDQIVESEANLARVEDILAELRPQARRLAAQAEQQQTRATAGDDLAAALVLVGHARWHEASLRATETGRRLADVRAEVDRAMADLTQAEEAVVAVSTELGRRATAEADHRTTFERAQARLVELRLRDERRSSELESIGRDRSRLDTERTAAEVDRTTHRRALATPPPTRDTALETAAAEAERNLSEAVAELTALRTASDAQGAQAGAARRAAAALESERDTARRREADASRRAADERALADAASSERGRLEERVEAARTALDAAVRTESDAMAARETTRLAVETAEANRASAVEALSAATEAHAAANGRLETLAARLAEEEGRGLARAARRRGGRRVDEELIVDPSFRAAVEAALGDAATAYVVARDAVAELAAERGSVINESVVPAAAAMPASLERRLRELGGGRLGEQIRRDPAGVVGRLLATAVWLPDVASAVELQPDLPPGWIAVVRDGSALARGPQISFGRGDSPLERRAEHDRLAGEVARLDAARSVAADEAGTSTAAVDAARLAQEEARRVEADATAARRRAEEAERVATRDLEATVREAGWHAAQAARLGADAIRAAAELAELDDRAAASQAAAAEGPGEARSSSGVDSWEARIADLRQRRDRIATEAATAEAARRDIENGRARAEAAIAIDDQRIAQIDRQLTELVERESTLRAEQEMLTRALADARAEEAAARTALDALLAADAADRGRLTDAERSATAARERLRAADDRARAAEVADLEARLAQDAVREATLVDLSGLGQPGLRALGGEAPIDQAHETGVPGVQDETDLDEPAEADLSDAIAAALTATLPRWAAAPPEGPEPPTPNRLATLRRRYHELGAANPYAVEEYAELKARLESLEAQDADLRSAIGRTRALIDELNTMIGDQFRSTFQALETAFDQRFQQLFGGGYAHLSLTEPDDLTTTGIEIIARPPGKKAQPLAMLSGGERALTAVALLFAMLEVRPVPFCVLDEVDAALDEANVGRFTDALASLADRTQFVVITHNRGTIERADALYGVTVGEDSVSRVVSLRLDQARAIADRQRSDLARAAVG